MPYTLKQGPKKSFGQNFLHSEKALKTIVKSSHTTETDVILEIGPGKGALTEYLLTSGACVISVEKDRDLIPDLEERFQKEIEEKRLYLHEKDILSFNTEILKTHGDSYKIVANIPYNITGEIIRHFLTHTYKPKSMTLLVQKEVAERICKKGAFKGKESLLSLSVWLYGSPEYISTVPRGAFFPVPGVDSAIIHVRDIQQNVFTSPEKEVLFWRLVHVGFAQKRKQCLSLLLKSGFFPTEKTRSIWLSLSLSPTIRAEDISKDMWVQIVDLFYK